MISVRVQPVGVQRRVCSARLSPCNSRYFVFFVVFRMSTSFSLCLRVGPCGLFRCAAVKRERPRFANEAEDAVEFYLRIIEQDAVQSGMLFSTYKLAEDRVRLAFVSCSCLRFCCSFCARIFTCCCSV